MTEERRSFEQLHDDERLAFILFNFVYRADVGMVQSRRGLRLALEPGQGLWVMGSVLRKEFEGDEAVQSKSSAL